MKARSILMLLIVAMVLAAGSLASASATVWFTSGTPTSTDYGSYVTDNVGQVSSQTVNVPTWDNLAWMNTFGNQASFTTKASVSTTAYPITNEVTAESRETSINPGNSVSESRYGSLRGDTGSFDMRLVHGYNAYGTRASGTWLCWHFNEY